MQADNPAASPEVVMVRTIDALRYLARHLYLEAVGDLPGEPPAEVTAMRARVEKLNLRLKPMPTTHERVQGMAEAVLDVHDAAAALAIALADPEPAIDAALLGRVASIAGGDEDASGLVVVQESLRLLTDWCRERAPHLA